MQLLLRAESSWLCNSHTSPIPSTKPRFLRVQDSHEGNFKPNLQLGLLPKIVFLCSGIDLQFQCRKRLPANEKLIRSTVMLGLFDLPHPVAFKLLEHFYWIYDMLPLLDTICIKQTAVKSEVNTPNACHCWKVTVLLRLCCTNPLRAQLSTEGIRSRETGATGVQLSCPEKPSVFTITP